MINAQFYVDGKATQAEICRAFRVPEIRMKRAAKIYRDEGIHGFYNRRSNSREAYVLKPEIVEKVEDLLNQGNNPKDIASQLGLKHNTLNKAIKSGKIKKKS
jgi:DNA invertase Pin-like site-specific DNA recombinase